MARDIVCCCFCRDSHERPTSAHATYVTLVRLDIVMLKSRSSIEVGRRVEHTSPGLEHITSNVQLQKTKAARGRTLAEEGGA